MISRDILSDTEREQVACVNARLTHRGPDSYGDFQDPHVTLAMRRLSIIDLVGGVQPLWNEDRTLVLVANGEVYNFVELRRELERAGHHFATGSDCETILHLYEEHGWRCVEHLRGMFAFALWDRCRGQLLLARDRMGEKPLYLVEQPGRLVFASELRALLGAGIVPMELEPAAIDAYFHFQYVPEPATPVRGVRKLPPGHVLLVSLDPWTVRQQRYWDMQDADPIDADPITTLRTELDRVSQLVVRSDVPVGVALSGGLDSSAVAALAVRHYPGQMHAFTVGYEGCPRSDERADAQQLAQYLEIPFHEVELRTVDVVNSFPDLVARRDDPIADISGPGYDAVFQLAREHDVPVLLQGQGGDELFWGYPWVRQAVAASELKDTQLRQGTWQPHFSGMIGEPVFWPRRMHPRQVWHWLRQRRQSRRYHRLAENFPPEQLFFLDLAFDFRIALREARELYGPTFLAQLGSTSPTEIFQLPRPWPRIDTHITQLISETYLLENGIAQGDRLSMARSVELRLPLLDYRLVETVIGLRKRRPDHHLPPKTWLREAVRHVLPEWVLQRHKRGFTPPVQEWHKALFRTYGAMLADGFLVQSGVLTRQAARHLATGPYPRGSITPLSFKALVLELWCRSATASQWVPDPGQRKPERFMHRNSCTPQVTAPRHETELAPVAVFAYKRPDHLRRALQSLAANSLAARSALYLFCDGPRQQGDEPAVARTRAVAREQRWCREVHIIEQPQNLGLARSIISGVTDLCQRYGSVIVVEDDLELSPYFLDFMNESLQCYRDEPRVMQVSGYMFPVPVPSARETLFLPLTTSWGWATWERAWRHLDREAGVESPILRDPRQRRAFDLHGAYAYSAMLQAQQQGQIDSWAIRWYHTVFACQGLVLYPAHSLVRNSGFDGSGSHCGTSAHFLGDVACKPVRPSPGIPSPDWEVLTLIADFLRGPSSKVRPRRLLPWLRSVSGKVLGRPARQAS